MTTQTTTALESLPYAAAQPAVGRVAVSRSRIAVIDVLRGLAIVVMLLDHVRENFFAHMVITDPVDINSTPPALYFTRVLAHFAAPVFVFLTGLGAWLYANPASGAPRSAAGFLIKRGLLLVVLEVTVINLAWYGKLPPDTIFLQVIWVIGLSMIVLGLMHRFPRWILAVVAFALVFMHNLLTPIHFAPGEAGYSAWTLLHDRGFLVADGLVKVKVSYPLLPWIGVIVLGYLAGPIYGRKIEPERRKRLLLALGAGSLALLALLRGFNIYGETLPWAHQESFVRTVMSWIDFTKYPPSLDFVLFTLGGGLLLLAWAERIDNWLTRMLATFGSVPMFFYIFHLYVLLLIQNVLLATLGPNHGARFGVDEVWQLWAIALALIPVLYFPCRAFARFKRTSPQAWVRYF
ncbi:MAG: heparan-alpha-glucosaminide N-acetyltransferase domain-containing protein [Usitatibacter sp.]